MKASEMYGKKYLSAADISGPVVTKVIAVGAARLEKSNEARTKILLSLAGFDKKAVVNVTNAGRLVAQWGDETDAWAGREIELRKDKVLFNGQFVDSLALHPVPDAPFAPAPAPVKKG